MQQFAKQGYQKSEREGEGILRYNTMETDEKTCLNFGSSKNGCF